ncbi:hypothetical protein HDV00_012580, partial [Rhizophlyctis rosea]
SHDNPNIVLNLCTVSRSWHQAMLEASHSAPIGISPHGYDRVLHLLLHQVYHVHLFQRPQWKFNLMINGDDRWTKHKPKDWTTLLDLLIYFFRPASVSLSNSDARNVQIDVGDVGRWLQHTPSIETLEIRHIHGRGTEIPNPSILSIQQTTHLRSLKWQARTIPDSLFRAISNSLEDIEIRNNGSYETSFTFPTYCRNLKSMQVDHGVKITWAPGDKASTSLRVLTLWNLQYRGGCREVEAFEDGVQTLVERSVGLKQLRVYAAEEAGLSILKDVSSRLEVLLCHCVSETRGVWGTPVRSR